MDFAATGAALEAILKPLGEHLLPAAGGILALFVIWFLFANRGRLAARIGEVESLKVGSVEIALNSAEQSLSASLKGIEGKRLVKTNKKAAYHDIVVTDEERHRLLNRLKMLAGITFDRRVLWIDDRPEGNDFERDFLAALNIHVALARSNADAIQRMKGADKPFDLIIADIERAADPDPHEDEVELAAAKERAEARLADWKKIEDPAERSLKMDDGLAILYQDIPDLPPVIIYITKLNKTRPVPVGAFGITNRPDELMHLVLDVFARQVDVVPSQVESQPPAEGAA
ncbi:MAG: hypothetical protein AAF401_00660 [Pseudomonadota bacterium]